MTARTTTLVASGASVDLGALAGDPRAFRERVQALDIASALAKINRFNGHTRRPYSVAEHSLHVVTIMERDFGVEAPLPLLCGLLHDAHEAYIGDLTTPTQHLLGFHSAERGACVWQFFCRAVQRQVLARFGLRPVEADAWAPTVKRADDIACATELRDLFPPAPDGLRPPGVAEPTPWLWLGDFEGFGWQDWRDAWLERLDELTYGAQDQLRALREAQGPQTAAPRQAAAWAQAADPAVERDLADHLDDSEGGVE